MSSAAMEHQKRKELQICALKPAQASFRIKVDMGIENGIEIPEVFKLIKFADGQTTAIKVSPIRGFKVVLKSRLSSYDDLITLLQVKQVLDRLSIDVDNLFISCFLGGRSDRVFDKNQSFDLKIIASILNMANYRHVRVLDPHSDVLPALVERCLAQSPMPILKYALKYINEALDILDITLISPDAGAYKKVSTFGEALGLPVIAASKSRSPDGSVNIELPGASVLGKNLVIVDDYLDGGRTFIELAKKLKEAGASKVFLYVTHGLFSSGFDIGREYIDHIFTTDSVKNLIGYDPNYISVYKLFYDKAA